MGNPIPLSGGRKMLPTREELERVGFQFFAAGKHRRGTGYTFLKDQFITYQDPPVTSPRTCEPGPGELTFVQTDGTQAISGGKLVFTAQTTAVWGDQGFSADVQTRAAGLALAMTLKLVSLEETGFGWHTAAAVVDPASMEHSIQSVLSDPAPIISESGVEIVPDFTWGADRRFALVLRAAGCFYLLDGRLLWVEDAGATASLYPVFSNLNGAGNIDNLLVTNLPARGYSNWGTEFGIATSVLSSPAEDATAAHADNFLTYVRGVTLPTAGTIEIEF